MIDKTRRDSYNKNVLKKFIKLSSVIIDIVHKGNSYGNPLKEILNDRNIDYLYDGYLYDKVEDCLTDNDDNVDWDIVHNDVSCWWEAIEDELYHLAEDKK